MDRTYTQEKKVVSRQSGQPMFLKTHKIGNKVLHSTQEKRFARHTRGKIRQKTKRQGLFLRSSRIGKQLVQLKKPDGEQVLFHDCFKP